MLHKSKHQAPPQRLNVIETVKQRFTMPFDLFPYQAEAVEEYAPIPRAGVYAEVGTGKTPMSTWIALFNLLTRDHQILILLPPILITQWKRWLDKIGGISTLAYAGTPAQRREMDISKYDFVLMSIQIFKRDFKKIHAHFRSRKFTLIVDEATSIKNVASDNFKKVKHLLDDGSLLPEQPHPDRRLLALTGTPLSTPGDAYAYIKLMSPKTYLNQSVFERRHVAERDYFDRVVKWDALDELHDNLLLNSFRVIKREVLHDLPEVIYDPIFYELDSAHLKLYRQLVEEQLLLLENGGKIDATTPTKLFHALQQLVINPRHFAPESSFPCAGYDLLDQVLEEVTGKKLLIFANYRMTIKALSKHLARFEPGLVYGDMTATQRQRDIDRFLDSDKCRTLIVQPQSGGSGLNLQEVCSEVLFLELPVIPKDFHQAVGRVDREGQKNKPNVRIATAVGTLQMRLQNAFLAKDALVNVVQGGFQDLRDALFGK